MNHFGLTAYYMYVDSLSMYFFDQMFTILFTLVSGDALGQFSRFVVYQQCSLFSAYATCAPDQHTCFNGQCVDKSLVCDGRRDCNDGTDEVTSDGNPRPECCEFQAKALQIELLSCLFTAKVKNFANFLRFILNECVERRSREENEHFTWVQHMHFTHHNIIIYGKVQQDDGGHCLRKTKVNDVIEQLPVLKAIL